MATANLAENLAHEVTCSICLDYFQDPVMIIGCGHNFCRACITEHRQKSNANVYCPECRIVFSWKDLKPNRQLGNIIEAAKQLSVHLEKSPQREKMCKEHNKALSLFCKTDESLLCTSCERFRAHRNHSVVRTEETATDYKVKLFKHAENLKKEKKQILLVKSGGEKPSQELLKKAQAERQGIVSEFQLQQQFLGEKEQSQLAKLRELEREIEKTRDDYTSPFDNEVSRINDLIGEIQKKGDQSASEFLENVSKPKWVKENVLLDPETAHPRYIVSEDRKSVSWGDIRQEFPYNPKRFEYARCVLGTKGFTSGKHYWTVDVEDVDYWAVGVARESVEREEEIDFEPDEGIWALGFYKDQYKALTSPPTLLYPDDDPTEIQVSLNYEEGTVAFFDPEDNSRLFLFQSIDFEGERIFPFFRIFDSSAYLLLCS